MKEQLISFETAKLAKDKGFDWETKNYYMNGSFVYTGLNTRRYNQKYGDCKSAPTQSLLQKWLRDDKGIQASSDHCHSSGEIQNWWWIVQSIPADIKGGVFKSHKNYLLFSTYEEALEAGLQEALKLLK